MPLVQPYPDDPPGTLAIQDLRLHRVPLFLSGVELPLPVPRPVDWAFGRVDDDRVAVLELPGFLQAQRAGRRKVCYGFVVDLAHGPLRDAPAVGHGLHGVVLPYVEKRYRKVVVGREPERVPPLFRASSSSTRRRCRGAA